MRTSALLAPSGGRETSVRGPLDMQDAHCAAAATVVSCTHQLGAGIHAYRKVCIFS